MSSILKTVDEYMKKFNALPSKYSEVIKFLHGLDDVLKNYSYDDLARYILDILNKYPIIKEALEEIRKSKDMNNFRGLSFTNIALDVTDDSAIEKNYYTSSSIQQYFLDISKYPLLTLEQEIYYAELKSKGDKKARETLITSNLRYVAFRVSKYNFKENDILDYIQAGNIGLMKAVDNFDCRKGFRLTTYATAWISREIQECKTGKNRGIHLSVRNDSQIRNMEKLDEFFQEKFGRNPRIDEYSVLLDLSKDFVRSLYNQKNGVRSLNDPISSDDNSTELLDFVMDNEAKSVEDTVEDNLNNSIVREAILKIDVPKKSKDIIRYRYGFVDGKPHTLEDTGRIYDVTRERIRQIEKKTLKKLANYLKSHYGYTSPEIVKRTKSIRQEESTFINPFRMFKMYDKKDVIKAINMLSDEDKEILMSVYDYNGNTINKNNISPDFMKNYYFNILVKIGDNLHQGIVLKRDK